MTRAKLIKQIGNHLSNRYIAFSARELDNGEFPVLSLADAISLAAVAVDWMVEHKLLNLKESDNANT